jgi:Na+/proline symporter
MALSIMATQASAITFISTTGQSYVDGMRFVQFYFGLPLAMVVLCATAVPIFHRAKVYTAYEYLERRFDAKTRALASVIFLMQRGLSVGITFYAPALVLSVIFGWPDRLTTLIIGITVVVYTVTGGIRTVTWTDVQQMVIIFFGLLVALVTIISMLPHQVSLLDAVHLAGSAGKLNAVTFRFDWNDRYNLWSGLIGGMFLALSYFGCDQSQVQRYLTGKSIAQSKLSLLFTAVAKIPMQFFILFIGAMVFVFYIFEQPPLIFQRAEYDRIRSGEVRTRYEPIAARYQDAYARRKRAALDIVTARHDRDRPGEADALGRYQRALKDVDAARSQGAGLVAATGGEKDFKDTNFIFLSFVTRYLPAGIVGLVIAVILAATMSSSSGEINSLATVSVVDIYKRHFRKGASDHHYLTASRVATAFWGACAVAFAGFGKNLGSLIEAVNTIGSLFYGSLLGVFVLAFFFKRVSGTGAFCGMLAGEAAICVAWFSGIAYLWYNVIGCVMVVATAVTVSFFFPAASARPDTAV